MLKSKPFIDERYLKWVRAQHCVHYTHTGTCQGRVEAHHVNGRGMGGHRRDDRDVVPLCTLHHRRLHDTGLRETKAELLKMAKEFWALHTIMEREASWRHVEPCEEAF